jgi:peptide chain release factor 2
LGGIFDVSEKEKKVKEMKKEMEAQNFWDDPEKAQKFLKKYNEIKSVIEPYTTLKVNFGNLKELFLEAEKEKDNELLEELSKELKTLEKDLSSLELKKMLSGELDSKSCFLSINAGAGGTESCDWVSMLFRMYQRWATKRGWKVEVIDRIDGDVAGIKSVTLRIEGSFAYGYAKAEKGVHRLVRISPFDSSAKRHTSFASLDVSPIIEDDIEIEIKPEDIRVDTCRASGAGGQHVNVTDSAVRILHIPTKIVVSCQKERSQIQNRETCMKMLKSKLYEKEVMEREEKLKKIGGEKKKIEWGSQIRSYVFHPYNLVKDTRTKHETGNVARVMDGDIDDFIEAYLKEFE